MAVDTEVSVVESYVPETTDAPVASLPPFEPEAIEWTSLGEGVEEGWLEVPIDYADPEAGTFRLYLVRHLAADPAARIGSLLVNPGGPGAGGTFLAEAAEFIYSPALVDSFDIVAWDPRGAGVSEPFLDCVADVDEYVAGYDVTPDDEAERQVLIDVADEFANECEENNADILQFIGTNNSARDIDTIRRALGEDEISYFGFSYGTRSRCHVGDVVPRHRARRRARRRHRPDDRSHGGSRPPSGGLRVGADDVPRGMQCRSRVRVPQRRRRRGCLRHVDGEARRQAAAERRRPSIGRRRRRPRRRRPPRSTASPSGRRWPPPSPPPSRATVPACSTCATCTTSGSPTARSATRGRATRSSRAWTPTSV